MAPPVMIYTSQHINPQHPSGIHYMSFHCSVRSVGAGIEMASHTDNGKAQKKKSQSVCSWRILTAEPQKRVDLLLTTCYRCLPMIAPSAAGDLKPTKCVNNDLNPKEWVRILFIVCSVVCARRPERPANQLLWIRRHMASANCSASLRRSEWKPTTQKSWAAPLAAVLANASMIAVGMK